MTTSRDVRDIVAGGVLIAIGLFGALYASQHYEIGVVEEMGPGMFPTAIGYVLVGLGVLIAAPAFFRAGEWEAFSWRAAVAIVGGVLLFALSVDKLGMVAALFLMTGAVVAADDKLGPVGATALAAALSLIAALIFRVGLDVPLPLFKWGF